MFFFQEIFLSFLCEKIYAKIYTMIHTKKAPKQLLLLFRCFLKLFIENHDVLRLDKRLSVRDNIAFISLNQRNQDIFRKI